MCRSRRELSNEYLLAKFGFDTAENELSKVCRRKQAIPTPGHKSGSVDLAPTSVERVRVRLLEREVELLAEGRARHVARVYAAARLVPHAQGSRLELAQLETVVTIVTTVSS